MLERFSATPDEAPSALRRPADLTHALVAEALGSGVLTLLIVAAGILGERYAGGSIGLAILVTALAAAAGFAALARTLGGVAGAYFNPAFVFSLALSRKLPLSHALLTGAVQIGGAVLGVMLAHLVTNTGLVQVATQIQSGPPVWLGEFIAAALVVFVLLKLADVAPRAIPHIGALSLLAVALATPSLSLANPAITLARGLTDSFTAVRLPDAGLIVACQLAGALTASLLAWWLFRAEQRG